MESDRVINSIDYAVSFETIDKTMYIYSKDRLVAELNLFRIINWT